MNLPEPIEEIGTLSQMQYARDQAGNLIELEELSYVVNTDEDERLSNVKGALERGLPEIQGYDSQDTVIAIVAGGPSLDDTFDDLKQKYDDGMHVISLNGAHDYLIERGIIPKLHIQLDARSFNKRFIENWRKDVKYYIASQSHPDVFDALEGANVTIFHCISSDQELELLQGLERNIGYVAGGSTVTLRAIMVMRTLGFHRMEIYGFDSCCMNGEHHAYDQSENHNGSVTTVKVGDREFFCYGWMVSQAEGFIRLVKTFGHYFDLEVHGDGLIAHIIKHSSDLQEEIEDGSTSLEVLSDGA